MPQADLQPFLDELAEEYLELHRRKESLFWRNKMGLDHNDAQLHEAEMDLRRFLGDPQRLRRLRGRRAEEGLDPTPARVLDGWIEMLRRNVIESERARAIQSELLAEEVELERRRQEMELSFVDPESGDRVPASSVVLGTMVSTEPHESRRRAAWQGLRRVEEFVLTHGFARLVRRRNALARELGHQDYYAYRVQWAEGMDKATLFGILDELERRTAGRARDEVSRLGARHPWNHPWMASGSLDAERQPYFRFEEALERWGRSFAGLGIRFRDARLTLDLLDRRGKYENGFMHAPIPAFLRRGVWLPAEINISANAVPDQVGAGRRALITLFHEGGHAAHFANVVTDAPCFSQEFAPTSTAFAETQSMFLDALVRDADWQTRYARDDVGRPIPFDLIRRGIEQQQPHAAWEIRSILAICYAEKEIYELRDEELSEDRILSVCREVERRLLHYEEGAPRPTLSVPHLLSSDASCDYHGYVLAMAAVEQTRRCFLDRHGHLVDNPRVGEQLSRSYWADGNAVPFLEYVRRLTGRPLSAEDLVRKVNREAGEAVQLAREAVKRLQSTPDHRGPVELDVRLSVMHGSQEIVSAGTPFEVAAERFRGWIRGRSVDAGSLGNVH